ncbi:transposase [Pandoraea horticolens]|uniref:Transposase n=1 Tax=Pandoraea horticolens TaxID=2508298 RepID=A0A5E4YTA2_9BURK|nr:transposase [Pandoraea horticolens]
MKKSRFTDEQIAFARKRCEVGTTVAEVCRKMGISEATFFNWKKKYDGLGVSELRRLKQLGGERTTGYEVRGSNRPTRTDWTYCYARRHMRTNPDC